MERESSTSEPAHRPHADNITIDAKNVPATTATTAEPEAEDTTLEMAANEPAQPKTPATGNWYDLYRRETQPTLYQILHVNKPLVGKASKANSNSNRGHTKLRKVQKSPAAAERERRKREGWKPKHISTSSGSDWSALASEYAKQM